MSTQNVNENPPPKKAQPSGLTVLCATFIPETRSMLSAPM